MNTLRSNIIIAILCFSALTLRAQHRHNRVPEPSPAVIQTTADKDKIIIGEPFHVHIEVTVPDNVPFAWPGLVDSLPHFDWLGKGKIDTTVRPGERSYDQYLTVTSFDSGRWAFPRLPFLAAGKKVLSDSIPISVDYTKIDPSKDFHDIKDIIDVPNPFARWIGWIIGGVTLISLVLVVLLVRKRKLLKLSLIPIRAAPRLSPYEEAIQQLDELERQHLPESGGMKAHYSRLGEILRLYLLRRLGIASFAETSEELIGVLRHDRLPNETFEGLAEALRMSDFVKFAKYQPGIAESDQHYRAVRHTIETLEQRQVSATAVTPEITQTS